MKSLLKLFTYMMLLCSLYGQPATKIISLNYISPSDLHSADIVKSESITTDAGTVQCKINSVTNELLLMGSDAAIQSASKMIEFLDVAPKQVVIEVQIIEVDNDKVRELGIDWQRILSGSTLSTSLLERKYDRREGITREEYQITPAATDKTVDKSIYDRDEKDKTTALNINSSIRIGDVLKLLQGNEGIKIVNIPKIVTINNNKGTIHDGAKVFYVDKLAAYNNIFQTQEVNAGLFLSVTPTLGANGFIKMIVEAKLTALDNFETRVIERGQMLENIVVAKSGESIILGGLKKNYTQKVESGIPFLRSVLPFIFSNEKEIESTSDVLLVLTPTVLDLNNMQIPDLLNNENKK